MGGSRDLLTHQPGLETALVRPNCPEDETAIVSLLNQVNVVKYNESTLAERRGRYARKRRFERVAEREGQVVGWIELVESGAPGCAYLRLSVNPEAQGQRIGAALYQEMLSNELWQDSNKVFVSTSETHPTARRFAEDRGFVVRNHMFESTLALADFDFDQWQGAIQRVEEQGIRLTTLAELGDTEENRYKLWEIEAVTDRDIPNLDVDEIPSWEDTRDSLFTASWFDAAGEFVALEGDRWVAVSGIAEISPGEYYNQHAGVYREYRGRGIASALKALALRYVKQKGGTVIRTNNDSDNAPMLGINAKFGYQPKPGQFDFEWRRPS